MLVGIDYLVKASIPFQFTFYNLCQYGVGGVNVLHAFHLSHQGLGTCKADMLHLGLLPCSVRSHYLLLNEELESKASVVVAGIAHGVARDADGLVEDIVNLDFLPFEVSSRFLYFTEFSHID